MLCIISYEVNPFAMFVGYFESVSRISKRHSQCSGVYNTCPVQIVHSEIIYPITKRDLVRGALKFFWIRSIFQCTYRSNGSCFYARRPVAIKYSWIIPKQHNTLHNEEISQIKKNCFFWIMIVHYGCYYSDRFICENIFVAIEAPGNSSKNSRIWECVSIYFPL